MPLEKKATTRFREKLGGFLLLSLGYSAGYSSWLQTEVKGKQSFWSGGSVRHGENDVSFNISLQSVLRWCMRTVSTTTPSAVSSGSSDPGVRGDPVYLLKVGTPAAAVRPGVHTPCPGVTATRGARASYQSVCSQ